MNRRIIRNRITTRFNALNEQEDYKEQNNQENQGNERIEGMEEYGKGWMRMDRVYGRNWDKEYLAQQE